MYYRTIFNIIPEINAKDNLKINTINTFTPVFLATAVSTKRLCENDSITAIIVISFTDSVIDATAPIAAYKFTTFPKTIIIAASPGNPTKFIIGENKYDIHSIAGVCFKIVTNIYTGIIILVNIHVVFIPLFKPFDSEFMHLFIRLLFTLSIVSFFIFSSLFYHIIIT
ncbi:hypothetical protein L21TH_1384 [Caldisalinibacter kiritimatiensis]|uniref:Uncharacterized protein n=1 Tax=Caldisalinibacter kiritimatiensis TaxID=1304284 RepID=R1CPH3_9FIRM|nr:hypothetical protein L21TH_1384 [Caldisalinibacter kiritimatiensis]